MPTAEGQTLPMFANPGAPLLMLMDGHRSEEHTSELQSQAEIVCRLLLEKKKPA